MDGDLMSEAEQQAILDRYPHMKAMSPSQAYQTLANAGCFLPPEMAAALGIRAGLGRPTPAVPWWKRLWFLIGP